MRAQRHARGSVRYDKRRRTWNFLWYDGSTRRSKLIGRKQDIPTKAAAWREAERLGLEPQMTERVAVQSIGDTVQCVADRYEVERMPSRHSTARVYRSFLRTHILPAWGDQSIRALQPRPVELWLRALPLSPKSKTHVRSLMYGLVEFAMWAGILEVTRNPISLVQNPGATKKTRKARSLTVEQFRALQTEMREPFGTLAIVSVCLGLRISETLALKWSDVDWLGSRITIQRGIVERVVGDVKTEGSAKTFNLTPELLGKLREWKLRSQFSVNEDWVFASPIKLGRLPYSYTQVCRELVRAAKLAGVGHLGTHAFRHTYRSWLDAVGTSVAVQQKMMRHADIRTTMNVYGDVVTDEMNTAGIKVAQLAFGANGAPTERKAS